MAEECNIARVLVVDDDPDTVRPFFKNLVPRVEADVVHPQEVTSAQVKRCELVLIDYRLEQWPERDKLASPSLQPANGLALAAVLQSHAAELREGSPTAFALYSGHLADIVGPLPLETRRNMVAMTNNLEWVFSKKSDASSVPFEQQVVSLACAVRNLPARWPVDNEDKTRQTVMQLLCFTDEHEWASRGWADMLTCRPPIHALSESSHSLAFLRWLLHRVMPYPCFLWNTNRLAVRLRITAESLQDALAKNNGINQILLSCRYRGILHDFMGDRWWRAGIESLLWELTGGRSLVADAIHEVLENVTKVKLEHIPYLQPVVCIDEDYKELPEPWPIEEAVRIQPDDWPAYAEQAWTPKERAIAEPTLSALVIEDDLDRLQND